MNQRVQIMLQILLGQIEAAAPNPSETDKLEIIFGVYDASGNIKNVQRVAESVDGIGWNISGSKGGKHG